MLQLLQIFSIENVSLINGAAKEGNNDEDTVALALGWYGGAMAGLYSPWEITLEKVCELSGGTCLPCNGLARASDQ